MIIFLGNKCDLVTERTVSTEEAKQLAEKHNLLFYECSAKTSINVLEAFLQLTRKIYEGLGS